MQLTQEQEKKGKVNAQNERIKRMLNFWHHGPSDRFFLSCEFLSYFIVSVRGLLNICSFGKLNVLELTDGVICFKRHYRYLY